MTSGEADQTLRTLRGLPLLRPDPARAERIRAQCRARMAERRSATDRHPARTERLEVVLLSGFSAVYLLAILYLALGIT